MWWNIFPSFIIIAAALGAPHLIAPISNWIWVGNMFRRSLEDPRQRRHYFRDTRLTGNPYKISSLDAIPDEMPEDPEGQELLDAELSEEERLYRKCKPVVEQYELEQAQDRTVKCPKPELDETQGEEDDDKCKQREKAKRKMKKEREARAKEKAVVLSPEERKKRCESKSVQTCVPGALVATAPTDATPPPDATAPPVVSAESVVSKENVDDTKPVEQDTEKKKRRCRKDEKTTCDVKEEVAPSVEEKEIPPITAEVIKEQDSENNVSEEKNVPEKESRRARCRKGEKTTCALKEGEDKEIPPITAEVIKEPDLEKNVSEEKTVPEKESKRTRCRKDGKTTCALKEGESESVPSEEAPIPPITETKTEEVISEEGKKKRRCRKDVEKKCDEKDGDGDQIERSEDTANNKK